MHTLDFVSHIHDELHAHSPWLQARDQATVVRISHCSSGGTWVRKIQNSKGRT